MEPKSLRCWACLEAVEIKQKKCKKCGSWLNFRKYLIFSNITLALILALLGISTAIFSILENVKPRGILAVASDGVLMKNKIEIYNGETFAIVIILSTIKCSVSGKLTYPVLEVVGNDENVSEIGESILSFILESRNDAEIFILPEKYREIEIAYSGTALSTEGDEYYFSEAKKYADFAMWRIREDGDHKKVPLPSDEGFQVTFTLADEKPCEVKYRQPDGKISSINISNSIIDVYLGGLFSNTFATHLKQREKMDN